MKSFDKNGKLRWSTYVGGQGEDFGGEIAVDTAGNIYIAGDTDSEDFPTLNALNSAYGGNHDGYVASFTNDGELRWSTYLGGNGEDNNGLTTDELGNVYITGSTTSTDFPGHGTNVSLESEDIFVTSLTQDGQLQWTKVLGGNGSDFGREIELDGAGNLYVVGLTTSSDFPTLNAYDSAYNGDTDVFAIKLSNEGELIRSISEAKAVMGASPLRSVRTEKSTLGVTLVLTTFPPRTGPMLQTL